MTIRARTTVAAALSALVSLPLASCGTSTGAGGGAKGATVGLAMPTKVSQRWIDDGNNMVDELKQFGFGATLKYADNKPETQVAQVEEMIDEGVDALVIAAVDGHSLTGVLKKAAGAHIPVIAYDRLILGTPHVDYYTSFDNEMVGALQANYLAEEIGLINGTEQGPFTVELFAGSADDNNTRYFWKGAMDVLRPHIQNKELVVRSGQTALDDVTTLRWDGDAAERRMDDILDEHYSTGRVDAVLSPYDGMSLGIIKALKAHGYGGDGKPLPLITGQDAEVPSVRSIIAGEQTQTVYKDTRQLALVTSYMVNAVIRDKKPVTNDGTTYDNGEKVVPAYLLDPVSVDRSNYREELVDSGYIDQSDLD
ncbi:multiple monosaccharide ABC transporter substrate-binding protein [Streptomyces minutiscleroticus]|uniref:multiple monosaccharide ABC transporter substrate-binding protein n=1 Tax=Streptomyces minutiscleroticus TaxID=68238 RepID=UPI003316CDDE